MTNNQLPTSWSARVARQNWKILALVLALYFVLACRSASRKVLYFDELFTVYISRATNQTDVWANLLTVPEPNPPVSYLLTSLSMSLLGESQFSARLPSIVAFGAFVLFVHLFAARRCGPACAWITTLFLLANNVICSTLTRGARPYALMLACAGSAFLCWQLATERRRAFSFSLLGLALSLAVYPCRSTIYAVLLFVPLAAGELTRDNCAAQG